MRRWGLVDFCELVLGGGTGVFIGVVFLGELVVGLFDLGGRGVLRNPENL
jgi:hypothetical protein